MIVGVDVGGTFTDVVAIAGAEVIVGKTPTTPDDQSVGVIRAVLEVLHRAGRRPRDVARLNHGTTTATNALLERRGGRTVLATTRGFGDMLTIRRQARPELYRLGVHHPPPLVDDGDVVEVDERLGPVDIVHALSDGELDRVVAAVRARRPQGVAVGLLFAYRDDVHECRIADALRRALPDCYVASSAEVLPKMREYERVSTTVADAYLGPVIRGYLLALAKRAADAGLPPPAIMRSNGGLMPIDVAARSAAWTVLSGPAGGVIGAAQVAGTHRGGILTLDMGGTSCDVALVVDGVPGRSERGAVGGHVVALPALDIETVSAGGGSIAWRDAGGALRVGPRSAGARPGPAAYGHGGLEPTVTDANVVAGRLPAMSGDGAFRLDHGRARVAVAALAETLGIDGHACALGIIAVANAEMVRALRLVSVERGIDVRDLTLVAFGGAGPLHAADVAHELGISRVVVPEQAGVLAAFGLAVAPERADVIAAVAGSLSDPRSLDGPLAALLARAATVLGGQAARTTVTADCRYVGQRHELALHWTPPGDASALRIAFDAEHERRFGARDPRRDIEVLSLRATVEVPGASVPPRRGAVRESYDGPTVISLEGATCWLPTGWHARRGEDGALTLERRV